MPQSNKKFLTAVVSLFLIFSVAVISYAWFAGIYKPGKVGFNPGSNADLPPMRIWMYTSEEDLAYLKEHPEVGEGDQEGEAGEGDQEGEAGEGEAGEGEEEATAGWEEVLDTQDKNFIRTDSSYGIPSAAGTATDGIYSFQMNKLHFGVIDNLISLKEDNIIYLRLEVNSATTGGDSMTFGFSYVTAEEGVLTVTDLYNAIELYDGEGNLANSATLQSKIKFDDCPHVEENGVTTDQIQMNRTDGKLNLSSSAHFLQIAAAVTTNGALTPDDGDFKNLTFTPYSLMGDTGTLDIKSVIGADYSGTYYIYLKLAPNLDFFVLQEDLLDQFIPAHIFFDAKLELTIH